MNSMNKRQTRILLIEDDFNLLSMLEDIYATHFDNVMTACDGASAYITTREKSFDLVVSDIRMPGFSGIELLTHLRAEGNNVPFIFMSGNAYKEDIVQALKLGASDFIEKPYTVDKLIETTFRVLEITERKNNVTHLKETLGGNDERVKQQEKMIGLFQAVSATRKTG